MLKEDVERSCGRKLLKEAVERSCGRKLLKEYVGTFFIQLLLSSLLLSVIIQSVLFLFSCHDSAAAIQHLLVTHLLIVETVSTVIYHQQPPDL
jgi:hypothetical protein